MSCCFQSKESKSKEETKVETNPNTSRKPSSTSQESDEENALRISKSPEAQKVEQKLFLGEKGMEIAKGFKEKKAEEVKKEQCSVYTEIFIYTILVVSLFFGDAWDYSVVRDDLDIYRNAVILFCIAVLLYDVLHFSREAAFYTKIFFWIDLIGTFVLLFDLTWIIELVSHNAQAVTILRTLRVLKLALKANDINHIFSRIIEKGGTLISVCFANNKKFAKVVKEYVFGHPHKEKPPELRPVLKAKKIEVIEAICLRVVVIVMVLIFVVPFMEYKPVDRSAEAWLQAGVALSDKNTTNTNILDEYVSGVHHFFFGSDNPLSEIVVESPYIPDAIEATFETRSFLREDCKREFSTTYSIRNSILLGSSNPYSADHVHDKECIECSTEFEIKLTLDATYSVQMDALYSMMLTILTILVLQYGMIAFQYVYNHYLRTAIVALSKFALRSEKKVLKLNNATITPNQLSTTPSPTNTIVTKTDRSPSMPPRKYSTPMDLGLPGISSSSYAPVENVNFGLSQIPRQRIIKLWYQANCKGFRVPVLREPNCNAGITTYIRHNDVICVTKSIVDGFHKLAEGCNFEGWVYMNLNGVQWDDYDVGDTESLC